VCETERERERERERQRQRQRQWEREEGRENSSIITNNNGFWLLIKNPSGVFLCWLVRQPFVPTAGLQAFSNCDLSPGAEVKG
jgi:hypothetical protein